MTAKAGGKESLNGENDSSMGGVEEMTNRLYSQWNV